MSTTLSTVISVGGAVALLAYAISAVDRDEQTRATHDVHDVHDVLPPDPNDGLTWHPRWDEEPCPGTGPRRIKEEL